MEQSLHTLEKMENTGSIEIRVKGKVGNNALKPENYDIKYISSILNNIEDLLFPNNRKDRPTISYNIQEGSVKHVFQTSLQAVIAFSAILLQVQEKGSIDFLELKSANSFENIQKFAIEKDYEFEFRTSVEKEFEFLITPKTKYYLTENIWADAEFYFYGLIKDAGGKSKVNIHLDTEDFGYLTISTAEDFLKEQEYNLLYKKYGVRVIGKQNIETGELDKSSLQLLELIDYNPKFDSDYLDKLILKARNNWKEIDPDKWIHDIRGNYEL